MYIPYCINMLCAAAVLISLSGPSWGQAAEACGSADDHLFYCTFDEGARKVGLCHYDGNITYEFGPANGAPELSMTRPVRDVQYTPFSWASQTIFESVALLNGDTRYEVFSSTARGPYDGKTEGGIVVTLPNKPPVTLTCDAGSVWPKDPFEGIGQIGSFIQRDDLDLLQRCLSNLPDRAIPSECLGTYRNVQIANTSCLSGQDETECWEEESTQWTALAERMYHQTLATLEQNGDAQLAIDLAASQDSWAQTRELDCRVKGVLVFAPDGGEALCLALYAADRMSFYSAVAAFSEFDG